MISYAQNREDVLLNRAFNGKSTGFYIDVGAGHPWLDSVTQHFSELGWHGINVEPRVAMYEQLVQHRPRDINLQCCLSSQAGEQVFYQIDFPGIREQGCDEGGLSTLDSQLANAYRREGISVCERVVPVRTLAEVCLTLKVDEIDFLKIDVEGHEPQVLAGNDFRVFRPRILVVEATKPRSSQTNHQEWEAGVLDSGYLFATFDGLNRYYVRVEDSGLVERLQVPVNIFDEYVIHQTVKLGHDLARRDQALAQQDLCIAELQRQVRKLRRAWFPPRLSRLFRRRAA